LHLGKKVSQGYLGEKQLDPQFGDAHVPQAEEVVQEELRAELLPLCRDEMELKRTSLFAALDQVEEVLKV